MLSGPNRGEVISVPDEGLVLGRGGASDFLIEVSDVSREHARIVRIGDQFFITDLASTNGTFVNGVRARQEPLMLANGARLHLGAEARLAVRFQCDDEAALSRDLYRTAMRDGLTNAYNRRAFDLRMGAEVEEARLANRALGLIIFDVDHFKNLNDRWGHQAGDEALREIASCLRASLRRGDFLSRYGGEEFAVIVRDATLVEALEVAERCRIAVSRHRFVVGHEIVSLSLSAGVSCFSDLEEGQVSSAQMIRLADQALYRSKREGRNRVSVHGDTRAPTLS